MSQSREFTGIWIPREVVEDERLTWMDRALYGEIQSFNICFKSNAALGERLGETERNIQKRLAKLKECGYVKQVAFDGRKRYLKTCLVERVRDVQLDTPTTSSRTPIDNNRENILTSEQSSRENEEEVDDYTLVTDEELVPNRGLRSAKKDTTYRKVFVAVGGKTYPLAWNTNRAQIQAAKNLLAERGLDDVKQAVVWWKKNQGEEYCPDLSTPWDLDNKWDKALNFKYRDR